MAQSDLTTIDDVKVWLGISSAASDGLLARLVTALSQAALSYMNRGAFVNASYTDIVDGRGTDSIILLNYPVTAIASLTVNNLSIAASPDGVAGGYTFDQYGVYLVAGYGMPGAYPSGYSGAPGFCSYFPRGRNNVKIAYSAGYATVPADIAQVAIEWAAERFRYRDRIGVSSITNGPGSTTSYKVSDIPPFVKAVLDQYKRVTMVAR